MNIMSISSLVLSECPRQVHDSVAVVCFDNPRGDLLGVPDQILVSLAHPRVFAHGIFEVVFQDVILIVIHYILYLCYCFFD